MFPLAPNPCLLFFFLHIPLPYRVLNAFPIITNNGGVPQGSILAPLVNTMTFRSIPTQCASCTMRSDDLLQQTYQLYNQRLERCIMWQEKQNPLSTIIWVKNIIMKTFPFQIYLIVSSNIVVHFYKSKACITIVRNTLNQTFELK